MELTSELSGASNTNLGSGSVFAHWRRKEDTPAPTEILDDLKELEWDSRPRDYSKEDLRIADQLFSIEDEHQSLPFETSEAEDGTPTGEGKERELPMRTLDNFVIYDASDLELASLDLIGTELNVHAVGTVGPIYMEEEEDEDDDGLITPTSSGTQVGSASTSQLTVELYLRNMVQYEFCFDQDGTVETWIQTTSAYYKLLRPAECYSSLYRHVIDCLNVITAIITLAPENSMMSLKDLLKVMGDKEQGVSLDDVERMSEFIVQHLDQWIETVPKNKSKLIENSRIYVDINKLAGNNLDIGFKRVPVRRVTGCSTVQKKRNIKNVNDAVLLHQNETTVTSWIHQLSIGMFGRALNVLGTTTAEVRNVTCDPTSAKYVKPQRKLREKVQWELKDNIPVSEDEYKSIYTGKKYARFFGTAQAIDESEFTIKLGDVVYVLDEDHKVIPSQYAVGQDGRKKFTPKETIKVKFGQVLSIHHVAGAKDSQNVFVHVHWLAPGCDTILQEMASMNELFLTEACDTILADEIYGVGRLTPLGLEGKKKVDFDESMTTRMGENEFFVRFKYNYQDGSFKDLGDAEQLCFSQPRVDTHKNPGYCSDCRKNFDNERSGDKWLYEEDPAEHVPRLHCRSKGWYIYAHEFVYIQPSDPQPGTTYQIGYINNISESSVSVEVLARVNDLDEYDSYKDPRHLYFTGVHNTVPFNKIIRKCFVFYDSGDQFAKAALMYGTLQRDVYFYNCGKKRDKPGELSPITEMRTVHAQTLADWERRIQIERYCAKFEKKLKGLDIFAGCGGLTLGLDLSGAVETKWAIEFAPSAANTLALNFPQIKVFNQCANILLSRAIQLENEGLIPGLVETQFDIQGQKLPHLPEKGEVDFIYGGPPCQGFSGVNRYKKGNDIKNSLVATFLSYVDHYRPRFVLLENVKGLITTKLGSGKNAGGHWEGGISNGVVKFIYRTLISMNYQCRIGLVQSGEYGVPQSRPRVIFLAARIGERLPDLPEPMYAFEVLDHQYGLPHIKRYHTTRNGVAALPRITIDEAVSDLPKFQYANPRVWPRHDPYSTDKARDSDKTIEKFSVSKATSFVGFLLQPYHSKPQSEFQRRLRTKLVPSVNPDEDPALLITKLVTAHVTRLFNKETTQRIVCVPVWPGADHRNLPKEMRPWCLVNPNSQAAKHRFWPGLFGRLAMEDFFPTALTDVQPCGKQGKVLHPTQRRVYTVRELARAQGFPDWFAFTDGLADGGLGGVKEWHRNIGNAVPIPLGEQLGRCIGYSVWWRDSLIWGQREKERKENEDMMDVVNEWAEVLNEEMDEDMPGNAKEFIPGRVYGKKLDGRRRREAWLSL